MSAQPVWPPIVGTTSALNTAPLAWIGLKVAIGVPALVALEDLDDVVALFRRPQGAVLADVADRAHLELERAEALGEGDLLVLLEELAREDQQGVFEPGGVEGLPGRLVELGQADAGDHCPERGVDRLDVEGLGHGCSLDEESLDLVRVLLQSIVRVAGHTIREDSKMRRRTVLTGAAATVAAAANLLPSGGFAQAKTQTINLQLGWLASNNNIGEVVAKQLGYFEEEKLNVEIQPGGPNIDGVAIVASGRYEIGQVSSSPSLMLAASQKIPVICFATGLQQHPYTFFSLEKKPVRTPKDMVGKKIGIQATGKILLTALLKKHNIPEKDVEIVVVGADITPLLTGQVDAVTGWLTITTAIKALGQPTGRRCGCGMPACSSTRCRYYATKDTIAEEAGDARRLPAARSGARLCLRAEESARRPSTCWSRNIPTSSATTSSRACKVLLKFAFNDNTKANGWGAFDPEVWQDQITLYDELKQFTAGAPKLDDVITTKILDATKDARPKIG